MKKANCDRRGMTMIELIVSFALAAIFFAALLAVVSPVYRMYQRTRDTADAQLIAGNVIDTIRMSADRAETLSVPGGDNDEIQVGIVKYYIENNRLQYVELDALDHAVGQSKPVYDEKFYDGKTITLQASMIGENAVRVTVTVAGRDGTTIATQTGVISTLRQYIMGSSPSNGTPPPEPTATQPSVTPPPSTGNPDTEAGRAEISGVWPIIKLIAFLLGIELDDPIDYFHAYYDDYQPPVYAAENILNRYKKPSGAYAAAIYDSLSASNTYYLGVYYTLPRGFSDPTPIVYLTDTPFADFSGTAPRSKSGNILMIYYNSNWYTCNSENSQKAAAFDGRRESEITSYITNSTNFEKLIAR